MSITLTINGQNKAYPAELTYSDVAAMNQSNYADDIVLVRYNNRLRELHHRLEGDGVLEFVTTMDNSGRRTYRRCATFLLQSACSHLYPDVVIRVDHSIGQGYYCKCYQNGQKMIPDEAMVAALETKMKEMVEAKLPITKRSVRTRDAMEYFSQHNGEDKSRLLRYRRNSSMNIYELDGYQDYFYGYMLPSTEKLGYFSLIAYKEGFMLMFPSENSHQVTEFKPSEKLFQTLENSSVWGEKMGISTVGDLNDLIARGDIQNLILVQESWMEQQIGNIAETIASDPAKKIILIAGPSSSGKTTFSHRLSIQLMAQGLKPHPIAMDDFYVNREDTPKDENGEYDFECLEALDIPLFNQCLNDLLAGEEVLLPVFNFKTGKREFRNQPMKLGEDDVLVIEGIHGLNEKLSYQLPKESKFKIYISALTQLDIDFHNHLPTTDGRLIRRMIRDHKTRATSAKDTIARWASVRRGEEKNIFPFQEEADVMFNSALIYEIAVLKCYAEPLLFAIEPDCPEYEEAKRLLKLLDYFLPVPAENIGYNSILREFVGGGCFGI